MKSCQHIKLTLMFTILLLVISNNVKCYDFTPPYQPIEGSRVFLGGVNNSFVNVDSTNGKFSYNVETKQGEEAYAGVTTGFLNEWTCDKSGVYEITFNYNPNISFYCYSQGYGVSFGRVYSYELLKYLLIPYLCISLGHPELIEYSTAALESANFLYGFEEIAIVTSGLSLGVQIDDESNIIVNDTQKIYELSPFDYADYQKSPLTIDNTNTPSISYRVNLKKNHRYRWYLFSHLGIVQSDSKLYTFARYGGSISLTSVNFQFIKDIENELCITVDTPKLEYAPSENMALTCKLSSGLQDEVDDASVSYIVQDEDGSIVKSGQCENLGEGEYKCNIFAPSYPGKYNIFLSAETSN